MATWVFGYGSLIWRPSFPAQERRVASLAGYTRRFWQGSIDHRGTAEAPGRVVTLIEEASAACVGVAYRVAPADEAAVLEQLDVREKNGYERLLRPLSLDGGAVVEGLVYLAGPHNPSFLGPAPLAAIARQVRASRGPSGPNLDYVLRLAEALREIGADDPHVFALEALLRQPELVADATASLRRVRPGCPSWSRRAQRRTRIARCPASTTRGSTSISSSPPAARASLWAGWRISCCAPVRRRRRAGW